jgi:ABC-type lipoprotein export system ATPase subunit
MNQKVLKIKNVSFKFNAQSPFFFKNLSVDFAMGTMHIIRGQNGVGKSTLLKILQGKLNVGEQLSGTFCFGADSFQVDSDKKIDQTCFKHVALVQQKFDLMLADQFSFTHNLQCANMPEFPTLGRLPEHKSLPELIQRFGIDINKPVKFLSGGQRQILAILMALQKVPSVLLLDEPTATLDEQNADMVMQFLTGLIASTGLTVLIICHDKELVARYAPNGYFEMSHDDVTGLRFLKPV